MIKENIYQTNRKKSIFVNVSSKRNLISLLPFGEKHENASNKRIKILNIIIFQLSSVQTKSGRGKNQKSGKFFMISRKKLKLKYSAYRLLFPKTLLV